MKKPYTTSLIGAHVFLIRNQNIFLVRRSNTGHSDGLYGLPAGHVDRGELILNAVVREAHEEAGVDIDPKELSFAHVVHIRAHNAAHDRMQCFFVASSWTGEPMNNEPHKADHADWFPLSALPDNMVPYIRVALEGYLAGRTFSELEEQF